MSKNYINDYDEDYTLDNVFSSPKTQKMKSNKNKSKSKGKLKSKQNIIDSAAMHITTDNIEDVTDDDNPDLPAGQRFENILIRKMIAGMPNGKFKKIPEMDRHKGTDLIYKNFRIDFTMNFADKDHMPFIMDSGIAATKDQNYQLGIRLGNSHRNKARKECYTEFDKPTIIIGITLPPSQLDSSKTELESYMVHQAPDLIEQAMKFYKDYTESQQKTNMTINPKYKTPNGILLHAHTNKTKYEQLLAKLDKDKDAEQIDYINQQIELNT